MLRSEAISIIKRGLGFRQTQDAAIVAALKQAQRDAEQGQTLPSWLVAFDVPIVVPAHATTAALPPDFLRFHEEYPPYWINSDGAKVFFPRRNAIEAGDAYGRSDADYVQVFILRNKTTIELVPPPKTDTTYYLTYYHAAAVLDSEQENEWLKYAPNYLVGMAGVHVAGDLRDQAAAGKFNTMAKIGQRAMIGDIVEDELAGRALIMGRNN
jgi:hypothetical protein